MKKEGNRRYCHKYQDALCDKPLEDTMNEILQLYDKLTLEEGKWIYYELRPETKDNQKKTIVSVSKIIVEREMRTKDNQVEEALASDYFRERNGNLKGELKTKEIVNYNKRIMEEAEKLKKCGRKSHAKLKLLNPREEYWIGEIDITFLKLKEKYGDSLFQKINEKKLLYAERKRLEKEEDS
jgi:hypothetical protein